MSKDTVDKIIGMLAHQDTETRCAAAMVLGRLRPTEKRTVRALRKGLASAPAHAKSYFLDALAETKDKSAVKDVVDLLEASGSIVEHAVQVCRKFGNEALKEIIRRHEDVEGWISGAHVKAVAGIHRNKALRMLIDRLPQSNWEQARGTTLFIAENYEAFPERAREYAVKKIIKMVKAPRGEHSAFVMVTCMKLITNLEITVPCDALLDIAEWRETASLTRHVLGALEVQSPKAPEARLLRQRIFEFLRDDEPQEVVNATKDLLAQWRRVAISEKELRSLATEEDVELKLLFLGECTKRRLPGLRDEILEHTEHSNLNVREAALQALLSTEDGAAEILRLLESSESSEARIDMSLALARSDVEVSEAELTRLRRLFIRKLPSQKIVDRAMIELLGLKDRDALNAALVRRSKKLIAEDRSKEAIHGLQELVRFRHGTPEARFILALANLRAADAPGDPNDRFFVRSIELLAPLSRTSEFDLARRIKRSRDLTSHDRFLILRGLTHRGGVARPVRQRICATIERADLKANLRREYDGLARSLEDDA